MDPATLDLDKASRSHRGPILEYWDERETFRAPCELPEQRIWAGKASKKGGAAPLFPIFGQKNFR